jgi:hypothetical protein
MSSQPKLPGTLPTPTQAKANLRLAVETLAEKRLLLSRLKDDAKTAGLDLKRATKEVSVAERDLLAADEGSPEDADAAARMGKWLGMLEQAEDAVVKLKDTARRATLEMDAATKVLAGARGDIRALQGGRQAVPKLPKVRPS